MKKILITGATGALGPCVVEHLVACGYDLRVLVRSTAQTGLLPASVEVVLGDITDPVALQNAVVGCEAVVHMAALLHLVNPAPERLPDYQRINVDATQQLLHAAQSAGVERFVYLSTIAVYGDSPPGVLSEQTLTQPTTPYGKSKLAGESFILAAKTPSGSPLGVVLRLGAVYGCRVKGNYQRLLQSLARNRFLPIGNGSNPRSLIYEKDLALAIELALSHPAAAGEIFNLTDGQTHSVQSIIVAICTALGRPVPRYFVPLALVKPLIGGIERAATLVGMQPPIRRSTLDKYTEAICVDSQKIQQLLGFCPRYTLQQGWCEIAAALGTPFRLPQDRRK